jgi:hypothetical protein
MTLGQSCPHVAMWMVEAHGVSRPDGEVRGHVGRGENPPEQQSLGAMPLGKDVGDKALTVK